MSDYEVTVPMCVRGESFYESDCGSQGYARALFVSWNILSMYIFVSMVRLSFTSGFAFTGVQLTRLVHLPYLREFQLRLPAFWRLVGSIQNRNKKI